ncbi:DNA-binding protein [Bordetella sp. N]|uniref:helix-turn-helix domain-containing transcriptional regulator n=1 Tax=Bordetella sp. N TaxID=1746199 RepID=UPI0007094223|nr:hypothetical protein [Bordetella sp. N]ALM83380.1 hypothetical protein ASB57_10730 [Bordetella sp. N]
MVKLREFDVANYLDNDKTIAIFLADAAKDGNLDLFLNALFTVARAWYAENILEMTNKKMAKKFETLRGRMSSESQARVEALAKRMSAEMDFQQKR